MKKKVNFSIVIPAYNEEVNIKRGVLSGVNEYLQKQKFGWEVIIVDDGSIDKTRKLVRDFVSTHPHFSLLVENHKGKGGAVISGVLESKGDYVLFTDMDQSTPIDQLRKVLKKFEEGYDLVIGSRSGRPGQTIVRKIMAYGFVLLRTIILRLPYKDTQCGFKAFKRSHGLKIFQKMKVFGKDIEVRGGAVTAGFDLELLFIARKLNLKIASVPVEWYEYGERKEVNPIKDSWDGLRDLIRIRLNAIRGKYK